MRLSKEKVKVFPDVPSVVLLGLDSISRASFKRRMPKTRHYLTHTLGGIELTGYNKVDDNTVVNIVPLLSGQFLQQNTQYVNRKSESDPLSFSMTVLWCGIIFLELVTEQCFVKTGKIWARFTLCKKEVSRANPLTIFQGRIFLGLHDQPRIF